MVHIAFPVVHREIVATSQEHNILFNFTHVYPFSLKSSKLHRYQGHLDTGPENH